MEYYTFNLCGLRRKLPLVSLGAKLKIASFNLLGDGELVSLVAREMVERIKYFDFDVLVGTEVKILPLIYEMSRILGQKRYVICRKKILGYMVQPLRVGGREGMILDGPDVELIKKKKIVIVNDVVSTGGAVKIIKEMAKKVEAEVTAVIAIIKQGDLQLVIKEPFLYLTTLPVFRKQQKIKS